MSSNKNKIVKDKYTYTKLDQKNTNIDFTYLEVPKLVQINDSRCLADFKNQIFGGYQRSKILVTLDKSIMEEKLENAVYWAFQLLLSGTINSLWDKLYSMAMRNINIQNPSLPIFLCNRFKKWDNIVNNPSFAKEKVLLLRNNPEVRNFLVEIVAVITLSRKRKLETLPKIKKDDFVIQLFQSKLEAKDTDITQNIFRENDPSEVRIAANEMAYHIKKRNMGKSLYWLSWLVEWDKLNTKQYGKFEVSSRSIDGVQYKWFKNIVWLIWEIINKLRKQNYMYEQATGSNENRQIDALWELYRYKFTAGQRSRKLPYIIWSIKYMTSSVDWRIRLVEREYLLFQAIANINIMVKKMKSQEVKKDAYQNQKFDVMIRNNYIMTQKHNEIEDAQQRELYEKEKLRKEKDAKKKKISVSSMDKLNALRKADFILNS